MVRVWIVGLLCWIMGASVWGAPQGMTLSNVGESANPVAQTVVEAMRSATGADAGMLGSAFFNEGYQLPAGALDADSILKAVLYPDDEVVVVSLKGEQILQALERAIELYPQKNNAFLQLAGMEVRFDPKAEPGKRIVSVQIAGMKLDPGRTYRVAMTAPLARGALGYFRIWNRDQIVNSTGQTVAEVVKAYMARSRSLVEYPAWTAL